MKTHINPFLQYSAALALSIAFNGMAHAAQVTWVGDADNEFMNGANWASDPSLPSLGADTWQVNGPGSQANTTLNITGGLTFTGTAGKIAFGASSGDVTLQGGDITLFQGTGGDIVRTDSTGITTLASNIKLGDGNDATTAEVTYALSSTSTTTGLLKVTGNISGGTKSGIVRVSFGSTDSIDGNYEVTGNIAAGSATGVNVAMRGDGTAMLTGTNTIGSLVWGGTAGTIGTVRINGGTTNVTNIVNSGLAGQTLRVSGGTLNVTAGARGIRTSVKVDGGIVNISGAERMSFNGAAGQTLTISSGELNYNTNTGVNYGVRLGNSAGNTAAQTGNYDFTATQTGGTFRIIGSGGSLNTFGLGGSDGGKTVAYNLSGGVLDVRGNNDLNGHIMLGADTAGSGSTTLALSGTGKLISRFDPGATSGGLAGSQASAVQVLSLTGGTLVAGRIDATNLRGSAGGTNGTLVNNGTTIAPGDIGTVGKTSVVGNMNVTTGTTTIDLGGLTASSVWQEATANSGRFDNLLISGNLSLGGTLGLNLVDGYVPGFNDVFKIIDSGTLTSGSFFTNVIDGGTLATLGNEGTFKVYSSDNDVFLSEFTVIPEPRAALLGGLGLLVLFRRRRRA